MTWRKVLLTCHLYLGLTAGLVLVVLGLTGSVIAFEGDIPHWLHPRLFYVTPSPQPVREQELIRIVEQQFAPARAAGVQILRHANLAHVVRLNDGASVFVNQYDGTILGSIHGRFQSDYFIGWIHQIHLRLTPIPAAAPRLAAVGKMVVNWVGVMLCLLVTTGLLLFWRTRRATVKWRAAWPRVAFDLHHVVGIYASLFLLLQAATGVLIGMPWGENVIFAAAGSGGAPRRPAVHSTPPLQRAARLSVDEALAIARGALPGAAVTGYTLPHEPRDVFDIALRVRGETSDAVHSGVSVDQFSGQVLQVRDFRTDSRGYYWARFNRALHTGDVLGTPSHIIAALSSLLLVVMVITGAAIWWRKLAV